ncbi:glycoside hydrolase [Alkaliphilus pronyensis]|uniref:Glycoside hydrolase n=1 Tax=Alkaliphilus pronyensis TaxID=1482732 RepID=A0A6I0EXE4_9FIRM|nr:putative glycoside hydrolase [Alkaliphilus pronyensis]KAB3533578.1 glycoside hydrolase [Alkaliphilus pronyensis]
MKNTSRILMVAVVLIAIFSLAMYIRSDSQQTKTVTEYTYNENDDLTEYDVSEIKLDNQQYFIQPDVSWSPYKEYRKVKGIFMTGHSIGLTQRFNRMLELTDETVINSWVIDVKDDYGTMTYKSNIKMVNEAGADKIIKVKDFPAVMETLRKHDIYPIARIVTFKDKQITAHRPDLAIKTNTGEVWRDRKGDSWLNPYNKESWEYVVSIAKEAAEMGFKDIQFDYVRFPTDGNRAIIDYGEAGKNATMAETIAAFLQYAREELKDYGVYISADIFGLVTTVSDDMRLGQHLESVAVSADILLPMVYPSHFGLGSYGVPIPDLDPYTIIFTSMNTARERIEAIETDKPKAVLRPWLQDFTASYLGAGYYQVYGTEEIKAQIKATYDAGLEEWVLWNAGNRYTWDALKD